MSMKNRVAILLIVLGLALSFFQLSKSGALGNTSIDRSFTASVVADSSGYLAVNGFNNTDNQISNNLTYKQVGSITNNFNEPVNLKISVVPVNLTTTKKWTIDLKFGTGIITFNDKDVAAKSISLTLPAGSVLPEEAIFKTAGEYVTLSYAFDASTPSGSVKIQLTDTSTAPRRQILR